MTHTLPITDHADWNASSVIVTGVTCGVGQRKHRGRWRDLLRARGVARSQIRAFARLPRPIRWITFTASLPFGPGPIVALEPTWALVARIEVPATSGDGGSFAVDTVDDRAA